MPGQVPDKPATILVVDDEPSVLNVIQALLKSRGHTVYAAESGQQALELFARSESPINMVITDVVMPNLSGPDLVDQLLAGRDDLAVMFISGNMEDARVQELMRNNNQAFLAKPFTIRDFEIKVRALLKPKAARRGILI